MNTHSLCCIGYITQDKVVTPKNTIYMPGGTSFYFAHAIKHLNANDFLLVTALADTDMGIVEDIRKEGISVKALHSTHSVCFENIYGENQNERTQRVTASRLPKWIIRASVSFKPSTVKGSAFAVTRCVRSFWFSP